MWFPDINDIIDAYISMKGGKRKQGEVQQAGWSPEELAMPDHERNALNAEFQRENRAAPGNARHISTFPLAVQRARAEYLKNKKR